MTLAERVRVEAQKAGYELPIDPKKVPVEWRRAVAKKIGGKKFDVDKALARFKPWRAKVTDELAQAELARAEAAERRKLELAAERKRRDAERKREAIRQAALVESIRKELPPKPKRKKVKRVPHGTAEYEFKSQGAPQLPAVRFGPTDAWIVKAIARCVDELAQKRPTRVTAGVVVREALNAVVPRSLGREVDIPAAEREGHVTTLGPFRLPATNQVLLLQVRELAEQEGVAVADVIRWALGKWLRDNGYGGR